MTNIFNIRNAVRTIDQWWNLQVTPSRVAILRILVGGYTLYYLAVRWSMYGRIFRTDDFLFDPIGAATFLGAPISPLVCDLVLALTLAVNVAFVLGWGFRVSGPVFAVLLIVVLTYRNSWSTIHHTDHLLVLHVLVLGLARSADALSIDALSRRWLAKWRRSSSEAPSPEVAVEAGGKSWHYGWPIQLMCAITVVVYFLAGVAKVCGPLGLSWALGDALRSQMAVDGLRKEVLGGGAPPMLYLLIDHVWLFTVLGVVTLVVELGAPIAMFSKRAARLWVVVVFGFHWGILLTMDITFRYQLIGIAFAAFLVRDFLPETLPRPAWLGKVRFLAHRQPFDAANIVT